MGNEGGGFQQFANHRRTPISRVAAMMPNVIAPRRLGRLRLMRSTPGFVARSWVLVLAVFSLTACRETTAPALRYPVLDDVGLADWAAVTVGADHTCGLTTSGKAYCWGSN